MRSMGLSEGRDGADITGDDGMFTGFLSQLAKRRHFTNYFYFGSDTHFPSI